MNIETGIDNKILREVSEEISRLDLKKYVKIGKDMIDYINNPKNGWVGLAAPQIGINKRLIVASLLRDYEDMNYRTVMMINPKILEFSEETDFDVEGCLSVPWKQAQIERAKKIKLEFLDDKWRKNTMMLENLAARIIQHEIDHLNWILLVDRLNGAISVDAQAL